MQQVFGTVNDLLKHEGSSDSFRGSSGLLRRLRLITYGITPLSPTSGVLEVRLASIRHPQIEGKIFTTSGGLANTFYG
jgi:phosphatidylinositol kinase/protein kinase (PI-3  family)